jgi:DNA-binding NarL/FixJ family response regulator
MKPYRILLAEDHILFRQLIKKSLEAIPDIKVIGEADDGIRLIESLKILKPHMIILDIGMPGLSGIEAAKIIKQDYPEIKILILTMYKSKDHLKHALYAKVDGYLLKENAFSDLITAIEVIRKGDKYISNIMLKNLSEYISKGTWHSPSIFEDFSDKPPDINEHQRAITLTPREEEILTYFAQGKSLINIGQMLSIKYGTVKSYMNIIKMKLHITNKVDLIKYAIKHNYTSIGS